MDIPTERQIAIDEALWEPAARIRWPNPEDRHVHLHYSAEDLSNALHLSEEQQQRIRSKPDGIWMGEHGDRLVVMFQDDAWVTDPLVRRFTSEHESFHLAAQYYGVRIGWKRLGDKEMQEPEKLDAFWNEILVASRDELPEQDCGRIESRFQALGAVDRAYAMRRAFWEWPAEYYSRARVFGLDDDERYLAFRRRISPGDTLYFAGGVAMAKMALSTAGDRRWQRRIEGGTNPLNVVLEWMGCPAFHDDPGVGQVTSASLLGAD